MDQVISCPGRREDETSDQQAGPDFTNHICVMSYRCHCSDTSNSGSFYLFIYLYIFFISKFKIFSCIPNMPAYGSSDCGNYLCQLLWTYSIWVSGPDGDALKWLIWVIQMAEQWWDQSSTMLNTPANPHPPLPSHPPRREWWLKAVNGFTACLPISFWRVSTPCACHLWKLYCGIHCCLQYATLLTEVCRLGNWST